MKIRIGTRGSDLALWQARRVRSELRKLTHENPEIRILETSGDRIQDRPLGPELGRSFFTKEIEEALLSGEVDLAVHSLKDLAVCQPEGLCLAAVTVRGPAGERLLIRPEAYDPGAPAPLPLRPGATVGTSSPRRRKLLKELRPDLEPAELRGNVPTRLRRVLDGRYEAVVLACAGLDRLGLDTGDLSCVDLDPDLFPGAPGQGALGLQCREKDRELRALLARLQDPDTARATGAERELLKALGGGCSLPLGARATVEGRALHLTALLFHPEKDLPSIRVDLLGEDDSALVQEAALRLRPALEQPLEGRRFVLLGGPGDLSRELQAAGGRVELLPCFDIEALSLGDRELEDLCRADFILVAGTKALGFLAERLEERGAVLPEATVLVTPGPKTAGRTRRAFPRNPVLVGDPPRNEGMGRVALARGGRFLVGIGAENGNQEGLDLAREEGVEARHLPLYRIRPRSRPWTRLENPEDEATALFLSPASVRSFPPSRLPGHWRRIAIGPTTGRALEDALGVPSLAAREPDLGGLLEVLDPAGGGRHRETGV